MIKNIYKKDYSIHQKIGQKGRLVDEISYIGDYYILPFSQKEKNKTNRVNLAITFVIIAMLLLAGFANQDSSRTFWIVFPYLIIYIPTGYMLLGAFTYIHAPIRMQNVQFETGIERMRRSGIGVLIFTTLSIILDIVYMILHRTNLNWSRELIYFFCQFFILAVLFLFRKYYARIYAGITKECSEIKQSEIQET